jgi:hypothetical protein
MKAIEKPSSPSKKQRLEEAKQWWQESIEQNEIFIEAAIERESVTEKDFFEQPEIDEKLEQEIVAHLEKCRKVGKAWLARKNVQRFPESPVYVIAFIAKGFSLSSSKALDEV